MTNQSFIKSIWHDDVPFQKCWWTAKQIVLKQFSVKARSHFTEISQANSVIQIGMTFFIWKRLATQISLALTNSCLVGKWLLCEPVIYKTDHVFLPETFVTVHLEKMCMAGEASRNLTPEEQLEFYCVLAVTGCCPREINDKDSHTGTAAKRCFRVFPDPLMKLHLSHRSFVLVSQTDTVYSSS